MTTIPSSAALIAAAADADLTARLIARGAALGYSQAQVEVALRRLAAAPVDGTGENTIASVYEYASLTHAKAVEALPPAPGVNPSAVTDAYLDHALTVTLGPAA